ncbi:MAG: HAMP domain-containing sensor histidine kinase [Candidatus Moranbacteria bacterium]|nr:HAMP domain-containing sensor histidine kinase [Candidatus Moranbacteria bacterium]
MEVETKTKKIPLAKTIWFFQITFTLAVIILAFFKFFLVPGIAMMIALLAANSLFFGYLFFYFRKNIEEMGTETKQKEKQIEDFDQITRQLVKRELELNRANQKLAELDKAKSDFVSVAAHQLRTPLTGIKWSYTALLDPDTGPLNPDQKEIIEKGLASISNTIDLINDLLNVAHIEEGKMEFHIKRQPILPLARKAVEGIKLMADEKKISLFIEIPEDAGFPETNIDADKMELVFANLLDNAVKYTPNGGRIDFNISQEQGSIKAVIQDSGIGIPKSQKNRLFTKFFRAENAVGVQTSGTGLGLYMVKKIIDRHGGKILVDSIENQGTSFVVTVPEQTAKAK